MKQKVKTQANQLYQHLITGITFMIPFVITGGIAGALSYLFQDGFDVPELATFFQGIGSLGMLLMWPAVAGGIAYSLVGRPGLVAGCLAGFLANEMNTAFFGAAIGGFLAGGAVFLLSKCLQLPPHFLVLKETMLIPVLSTSITFFCLLYIVGKPLMWFNQFFTNILNQMSKESPILLGALIGVMMIIDLAGPIGKAAYFFGVASLDHLALGETSPVMAAVMVAGMVPPLSLALTIHLRKKAFPVEDVVSSPVLWVLGATFVTESVIPYAIKDLLRILPAFILGSVTASCLSMVFKCGLSLPHGGIFALIIPGAVSHLPGYLLALVSGVAVSTLTMLCLKKGHS